MASEMDKLMKDAVAGRLCPTNCGGKIEEVDYSPVGQGRFLECNKHRTIHYRRIMPPNLKTAVVFTTDVLS